MSFAADLAQDLRLAAGLLTRLPVGPGAMAPEAWMAGLARACRVYPLIGAALGALGGAVYAVALGIGLPPSVAAGLALAVQVLATGALHEDGLADCVDGLGGGGDRAKKLAIMSDSRIGAYGTAALILALGLKWAALAAVADPVPVAAALIAAGALGRTVLPPLQRTLPPAKTNGLAADAGLPDARATVVCLAMGALIAWGAGLAAASPAAGAVWIGAAAVATTGLAALARRQIGGQTGDVLGGAALLSEVAVLIGAAALF